MLIVGTLIILNICVAQCATGLQEAFQKLYSTAVTRDSDAFKTIYEPLSPENQNVMRQNFLLSGKQNAEGRSALKFFIDYWYGNRPETALDDDYAKEAFSLLFPVFQETSDTPNQEGGIPSVHTIVTSSETSLLRLWIDAKMDVDTKNPGDQKTAVHLAIAMDKYEYVDLLGKAGANINVCDMNGRSAVYYAMEKNSNTIITILLEKVTVTEACCAIASVFNTRNNHAIQYIIKEVQQELSQLSLTPSNKNKAIFSTWSHRVRDFIAIWDDLLRHIFVSQAARLVVVHVAGGRFDYRMVSTIGQLHQLVVSSGAATSLDETTSDACSGDMMTAIALIGSGILTPNHMGKIKVNHDPEKFRFEVMPSGTPDEGTTSGVACANGGSAAAACSLAPSSNAAAQNRGSRVDPVFPADPRMHKLRQMFESLQIGADASSTSACAGTSSTSACASAAAAPLLQLGTGVAGESLVPHWREEAMHRRSRSRSPMGQSRSPRELGHSSERHHQEARSASPSSSQGRGSEGSARRASVGSAHADTWWASRRETMNPLVYPLRCARHAQNFGGGNRCQVYAGLTERTTRVGHLECPCLSGHSNSRVFDALHDLR